MTLRVKQTHAEEQAQLRRQIKRTEDQISMVKQRLAEASCSPEGQEALASLPEEVEIIQAALEEDEDLLRILRGQLDRVKPGTPKPERWMPEPVQRAAQAALDSGDEGDGEHWEQLRRAVIDQECRKFVAAETERRKAEEELTLADLEIQILESAYADIEGQLGTYIRQLERAEERARRAKSGRTKPGVLDELPSDPKDAFEFAVALKCEWEVLTAKVQTRREETNAAGRRVQEAMARRSQLELEYQERFGIDGD